MLAAVGAAGIGLTTTVTVPGSPVHPPTVAVTEYVPLAAVVGLAMVGFCTADENEFGPVHEYDAPAIALAVKLSAVPAQTGLLLDAVGAAGVALTVTTVVANVLVHPATVTVTE